MPDKQIFFDPQRKRWKRLRRILDTVAVATTLVVAGFIFNSLRGQHLPELLLPTPKHNYRAVIDRTPLLRGNRPTPSRRKTHASAFGYRTEYRRRIAGSLLCPRRRHQLFLVQRACPPDRHAFPRMAACRHCKGNADRDERRQHHPRISRSSTETRSTIPTT